jgi:fatty-acyl-CoA synthase
VLIVAPRQGRTINARELLSELRGKVVGWWIPDEIVQIDAMPLAATGKIDKNQLRADYANGKLVAQPLVE